MIELSGDTWLAHRLICKMLACMARATQEVPRTGRSAKPGWKSLYNVVQETGQNEILILASQVLEEAPDE